MTELPLGTVIAFDFDKWDVAEEIALIHKANIRRVQVYRNYLQGTSASHIREVLQHEQLVADSMHAYIDLRMMDGPSCDLSAEDPAEREAALEIMRGETGYARILGCTDIVVHPVGPGSRQDKAFRPDALAASVAALAQIGQETGARFLVENMPPPMFGRDAALLRRIVDQVASPHVGLAYDSGHASLAGDAVGIIHAMGPRLWGVHLHDNRGIEDSHFLPGMGTVPFEEVAQALAQVGFSGTFMLEVYRDTNEVWRDLTPERLAYVNHLCRVASGIEPAGGTPAGSA